MSISVEQASPPLPEESHAVYSSSADAPIMNPADINEVKRIIAESKRGFPVWAKESIGFAVVMAGAVWIIQTHIPAQIGSQTSSIAADVAVLKSDVGTIQKDIADIKKDIKDTLNRALDRAYQALPPQSAPNKNVPKVTAALRLGNEAIQIANDFQVGLDPVVLVGYGQRAISSAHLPALHDVAWRGAGLSVAQRSFINSDFEPPLPIMLDRDWVAKFSAVSPIAGKMYWRGSWVNHDHGAALRRLGSVDPNATLPAVPNYLLIEHAVTELDGIFLRNVVFRDSHIIYKGAPIDMQGTYFVRCTFDIPFTVNGYEFSQSLLASVPVTFRSLSE